MGKYAAKQIRNIHFQNVIYQLILDLVAYYYYPEEKQCDLERSDMIHYPIQKLKCDHPCESGEYLDIDMKFQTSTCMKCPANTYSVPGVFIDGNMDDWKVLKDQSQDIEAPQPIEFNCFFRNENLQWIVNEKCTPWTAEGNYIRGGEVTLEEDNVSLAFEMIYTTDFVQPGYIEFKYRKDTMISNDRLNGDFSFVVNLRKVLGDFTFETINWKTYRYNVTEPGHYVFAWVYNKQHILGLTEQMNIELEYIKIVGTKFSAHECLPCIRGQSSEGSDKCTTCEANQYLDTEQDINICLDCAANKFSYPGSIGKDYCLNRLPCTKKDYIRTHTKCQNDKRNETYQWITPQICDPNHSNSVALPDSQIVQCKQCGPGFYQNETTGECQYCQDGAFQGLDFHNKTSSMPIITKCETCKAGSVAVKALDYVEFDEIPMNFTKSCVVTNSSHYSSRICDVIFGWRPDGNKLVSGIEIPSGVKIGLQRKFDIVDDINGFIRVNISAIDFQNGEMLCVLIDGYKRAHIDTDSKYTTLLYEQVLARGGHTIEIVFQTDKLEKNISMAQGVINSLFIQGSDVGGAIECKACVDGHIASAAGLSKCQKCNAGYQSNAQNTQCVKCPEGQFNPVAGERCRSCPSLTHNSLDNTFCILYDRMTFSDGIRIHPHYLRSSHVCSLTNAKNYCENQLIGPIYDYNVDRSKLHSDAIFYITENTKFDLKTMEYHEVKGSKAHGFIFGLLPLGNQSAELVSDDLLENDETISESCLQEVRNMRIKKNLGSLIETVENITRSGYTVRYNQGDICDLESGTKFTSEIQYICDTSNQEYGWPNFIRQEGQCHFVFDWISKYACSHCSNVEVMTVQTPCNGISRTVGYIPQTNCSIFHSQEILSAKIYEEPLKLPKLEYISDLILTMSCSTKEEFFINPVLQAFIGILIASLLLIIAAIIIVKKKYNKLKVRYSKLGDGNNESQGQIEMQIQSSFKMNENPENSKNK
eukprot:403358157